MARVTLTREWADGDVVRVQVTADNDYPDALDEARVVAKRAFVDALAAVIGEDYDETAALEQDDE